MIASESSGGGRVPWVLTATCSADGARVRGLVERDDPDRDRQHGGERDADGDAAAVRSCGLRDDDHPLSERVRLPGPAEPRAVSEIVCPTVSGVAIDALAFFDDEGAQVILDAEEAASLWALTGSLEAATVSACPTCRARVLACVALADVLEVAPPHPRARELLELADDAPTLHLYVSDMISDCRHRTWRDPGHAEWSEALGELLDDERRRR